MYYLFALRMLVLGGSSRLIRERHVEQPREGDEQAVYGLGLIMIMPRIRRPTQPQSLYG